MNELIEKKINELENSPDDCCWYIVRQKTTFWEVCYIVSVLLEFQQLNSGGNYQQYYIKRITQINREKGFSITTNYRATRMGGYYGLLLFEKPSDQYPKAIITKVFDEITDRCQGEYERMNLYQDIMDRQVSKLFCSNPLDEKYDDIRKDYRLFPVMLLYKILLELGQATDEYKISKLEFEKLVITTKKYGDYLDTLFLIYSIRNDETARIKLEKCEDGNSSRINLSFENLSTINKTPDGGFELKDSAIEMVRRIVYLFEQNGYDYSWDDYFQFLTSSEPIVDAQQEELSLTGENIIYYGVPGAGKSHVIKKYAKDEEYYERVVFHPDYSYADFIGQILPVKDGEKLNYEFVPGPFTRILTRAYNDKTNKHHYYLLIEEINRGNAPAIFGDIFQLLDRGEDGSSEYEITNADIAKELYGKDTNNVKVSLPSNLSILATMNTSDQNVFTLDTAFQRRWKMKMIDNDFENNDHQGLMQTEVLDTGLKWKDFGTIINKAILDANHSMLSTADKQLGTHFVRKEDLQKSKAEDFAEKVLKYLWDDASQMDHSRLFNPKNEDLSSVIKTFKNSEGQKRLEVFSDGIFQEFLKKINNSNDNDEMSSDLETVDDVGEEEETD